MRKSRCLDRMEALDLEMTQGIWPEKGKKRAGAAEETNVLADVANACKMDLD